MSKPTSPTTTSLWWSEAWDRLAQRAETHQPFVATDLVKDGLGEPPHHCRWGQLFAAAHRAGLIEPVAATRSTRRTTSSSLCMVWRGAPKGRTA